MKCKPLLDQSSGPLHPTTVHVDLIINNPHRPKSHEQVQVPNQHAVYSTEVTEVPWQSAPVSQRRLLSSPQVSTGASVVPTLPSTLLLYCRPESTLANHDSRFK